MEIAIYEIIHLDWIIPIARLLEDDNYNVTFYVSSGFEHTLKKALPQSYHKYTWVHVQPEASVLSFYKSFSQVFSKPTWDIILLNSVDSRHLFIYFSLLKNKKTKILLNVHDVNNFFKPQISFQYRKILRKIGKRLLNKIIDGFVVNANEMKKYIEDQALTKKPVYWIPPVIFESSTLENNLESGFTVVIPGTVDKRRRDYDLILSIIREFWNDGIHSIRFIIAGQPAGAYGNNLIETFHQLADQGFPIVYFTDEIPELQFQKLVASATVILSPLQSQTAIHDNITEAYGTTKGSGNVYDAIRHAKPMIIPASIQKVKAIESSCITYSSGSDLKKLLLQLATDQTRLLNLQTKAIENSLKFTKEKTKEKFNKALQL